MRIGIVIWSAVLPLVALRGQGASLLEAHVVLPPSLYMNEAVASGDVNGDGLTDLVAVPSGHVWLASADGRYLTQEYAFVPTPSVDYYRPRFVLADIDGDGDLDACVLESTHVFGSNLYQFVSGGGVGLYSNDGTGRFTRTGTISPQLGIMFGQFPTCLAAGDVDADGDMDLMVGVRPWVQVHSGGIWMPPTYSAQGGQNRLWKNLGGGMFADATNQLPADADFTAELALADFDGDGDLDVFFANYTSSITPWVASPHRLYLNSGTGLFTASTTMAGGNSWNLGTHARDFDLDGDVDILVHDVPQPRLLSNSGNGTLTSTNVPAGTGAPEVAMAGDWNGDGLCDYAIGSTTSWQPVMNLGGGGFAPLPAGNIDLTPASTTGRHGLFVADFERDGDLDLFVGADFSMRTRLWRNGGSMPWQPVSTDVPETPVGVRAIQLVDFDGDGDLDTLAASSGPGGGRCYENDGHGRFAPRPNGQFTSDTAIVTDLVAGDVDGDGDLDLLGASAPPRLYRNVGGTFGLQTLPLADASALALGDLDGDGDLDLYASRLASAADTVLINQGGGSFVVGSNPLPTVYSRRSFCVDLDGDGDLDILAIDASVSILRNQGAATFINAGNGGISSPDPQGVAVADLDGDLDLDVLIGATLWRNNGAGAFLGTATSLPIDVSSFLRVAAGDFDGDGDQDLVRTLFSAGAVRVPSQLYHNDGSGVFTLQPVTVGENWYAMDLEVGDLDGDGDLDAVTIYSGAPRLLMNRQRHLSWRTLPRLGALLVLDVEGAGSQPFAIGLALAPALLAVGVPGILRLDPSILQVATFGVLDPGGRAQFQGMVPNATPLLGLSIFWQAAIGSPIVLGNLEVTTLLAR